MLRREEARGEMRGIRGIEDNALDGEYVNWFWVDDTQSDDKQAPQRGGSAGTWREVKSEEGLQQGNPLACFAAALGGVKCSLFRCCNTSRTSSFVRLVGGPFCPWLSTKFALQYSSIIISVAARTCSISSIFELSAV